jgi:hypothetical protein
MKRGWCILLVLMATAVGRAGANQLVGSFEQRRLEWNAMDSRMRDLRFEILQHALSSETPQKQALYEWAESLISTGRDSLWMTQKNQIEEAFQKSAGPWDHASSHFCILDNWLGRTMDVPNALADDDVHAVVWELFKAEFERNRDRFGKSLKGTSMPSMELESVPNPLPWWRVVCLVLLILGMVGWLVWDAIHRKEDAKALAQAAIHPVLESIRLQVTSEPASVERVKDVDFAELKLGFSPLQPLADRDPKWSKLSFSELTLLHLLFRGHTMLECSEFLNKSKGHIYNQRSKIRKMLEVPEELELKDFIDRSIR